MQNIVSNDPLVSAIFEAVASIPGEPFEKMRAIRRAGMIANAYIGENCTPHARETVKRTFTSGDTIFPSPSGQ